MDRDGIIEDMGNQPPRPAGADDAPLRLGVPQPPGPMPVTWRLSRRRGWRALFAVIPLGYFANLLWGHGEFLLAVMTLLAVGVIVIASGWFLLVPGQVRLDADGVRWGRRDHAAWGRIAEFRLNEVRDNLPLASTYWLPMTPEEARRQWTGAETPRAVDVPAWVTEMSPWGVVALLNRYRSWALEQGAAASGCADGPAPTRDQDSSDS
jgi:hypothetical protein